LIKLYKKISESRNLSKIDVVLTEETNRFFAPGEVFVRAFDGRGRFLSSMK
jgi:hypothetical protein